MTQTEAIRAHLLAHNSITPLEALNKFGCFRLAARIKNLKDEGLNVQSQMVERDGKRFATYSLAGKA